MDRLSDLLNQDFYFLTTYFLSLFFIVHTMILPFSPIFFFYIKTFKL